jgi:hypothetical protein
VKWFLLRHSRSHSKRQRQTQGSEGKGRACSVDIAFLTYRRLWLSGFVFRSF